MYDVYSLFDVTPVKARGAYIYDLNDEEYLDFYGGHAVISIGHCHPDYIKRVSAQLDSLGFYSNSVKNPLQAELAQKLKIQSDMGAYALFLVNSGAEANENALKLASFYNGRKKIIALANGFHGRTSAAINITHSAQKHQAPINKGIHVDYFDMVEEEQIVAAIRTGDYACIILEAIQGIGGLDEVPVSLQTKIEEACKQSNTILILDEIQCGYGRSGNFFAFQNSDIQPDIVTLAKGMGNGFPIGGLLIKLSKMPPIKGRLGTTFGGNHLACAAGIAVLDIIKKEDLIQNASIVGQILKDFLYNLSGVKRVNGRGLMLGIEFDFPIAKLRSKLVYKYHLFTGSSINPNLLRILPPLSIGKKETDQFCQIMSEAVESFSTNL